MPIIQAEQLTKHYRVSIRQPGLINTWRHFVRRNHRTVKAVSSVSFSIEPGEIVGFLGPNGAGKTTVLKMISGLICPTSGHVEVAGHTPFDRRPEFLRQITLVMGQKQQLIWDLPALDSFRINAAIYGIPSSVFHDRLINLCDMLQMSDNLTTPVRKLSLGERMKAELIAALLHNPRVLFLDEPTLGLDVNAQAAVRRFLRNYCQETGATVLLTSHYMADITSLCERVILIHEGSLIYDGLLSNIVDQFAPYREVKIELGQAHPYSPFLPYGSVEAVDGHVVRLLISRDDLTETISKLLADFEIIDLTVQDPPIEGIIGKLFLKRSAP